MKCVQSPNQNDTVASQVGTDAALEKAIGVVEKTQVNQLCLVVMDYVNEERDGIVKDQYRWASSLRKGSGWYGNGLPAITARYQEMVWKRSG